VAKVKGLLDEKSYDLMSWGTTSSYNEMIERQGVNLPKLPQDRLIVIAGNTAKIWPLIKKMMAEGNPNPFNQYSLQVTGEIQKMFETPTTINFTHEWSDPLK
jgi:hypothetical protein